VQNAIIDQEGNELDSTITTEPTAEEAAELKAAIQQIFEQIEQADARIKSYQEDTDRLRAETRAMLAQLRREMKA
jgi:cytochrome c556